MSRVSVAEPGVSPGLSASPSSANGAARGERKRELLTYWAYRAGEWVISSLPRGLLMSVAAAVGNVAYDLAGPKRGLIQDNLSRPVGLPPDHRRVRAAARRAFRNYAKYLVDMMRLGGMNEAEAAGLVRIEDIELLHQARAEGKGVLVCTVHVGGMDIIGAGLKARGESLHVVADDTTYGRLYDHLEARRARHDIYLIGWRNLRGIFRALRDEENVVLFCDGGYRRGDVPVELCGEATTLPIGPATLAAKTGAPMMPVACGREPDDTFVARGLPSVHCATTDPVDLHRATQVIADALGKILSADPGQWYMFRPVWPQTDADRAHARAALEAARRGEDWTRIEA